MNISGIRPYGDFYQYNSIKMRNLVAEHADKTEQENLEAVSEPLQDIDSGAQPSEASFSQQQDASAKQSFNAFDYAKQYKPDEEFSMKGADSDLSSLDIERAVSDMDKDQVLRQYQFFVGNGSEFTQQSRQTTTHAVENFTI